jgi:hypothetical protein
MTEVWSNNSSQKVLQQLASSFKEKPRKFFTEHDLHSHLYHLVESELQGKAYAISKDGFEVGLVHHEYPTPFRCDMSNKRFCIKNDPDITPKKGRFKRGHYDLVVLNPEFVKSFDAVVVAGKNYKRFIEEKSKINASPLLWACEIVFGAHVEDGLPANWENLVIQDADKIRASLIYSVGKVNFLKHGSVMVFIGIQPNDRERELEANIQKYSQEVDFPISIQTA